MLHAHHAQPCRVTPRRSSIHRSFPRTLLALACVLGACTDSGAEEGDAEGTTEQLEESASSSDASTDAVPMERPPVECGAQGTGPTGTPVVGDPHWVGTWGTSPQLTEPDNEPPVPLAESTLRQFAYVSIGGGELRVQISNEFGDAPVTVNGVHFAIAAEPPAIDLATDVALQFAGAPSVTIPAGEAVYSDPFVFDLSEQTIVAVTTQFGAVPVEITGHPGSRTTSYIAAGDALASEAFEGATTTDHWYYLTRIEVVAPPEAGAVVVFGDSITDGRGSTTNGNDRWPDALSRRFRADPTLAQTAVINAGIGGNSLVTSGLGPKGPDRFPRDVLGQSGVRWVVILHGINDIGSANNISVDGAVMRSKAVIEVYEELIDAAHAQGLPVYGVPLLPMEGSDYYSPNRDQARMYVNDWIRMCNRFDAVLDLETAVADPAAPTRLLPAYDSSDGLHLNPAGYQAMADAVDLSLFVP